MVDVGETSKANRSRRSLLAGRGASSDDRPRPPWTNQARVREFCTSCGDCIRACPEAILLPGPAGTPVVDFSKGACTFCYACAEACEWSVFSALQSIPWDLRVSISDSCLLTGGVSCQSCTDACDETALRFDFRSGLAGSIQIDLDRCTGCGACVSVCPVNAMSVASPIADRS